MAWTKKGERNAKSYQKSWQKIYTNTGLENVGPINTTKQATAVKLF
jgi:hypothetical protein